MTAFAVEGAVERLRERIREAADRGVPLRVRGAGTWMDAGRPVDATDTISTAEHAGIVPKPGAEDLHFLGIESGRRERPRHGRHGLGLLGNKERVDLAAKRGDLAHRRVECLRRVIFDFNHPQPALGRDLLELG